MHSHLLIVTGLVAAAFTAVAAEVSPPTLGKTWMETQITNPESPGQTGRKLVPLAENAYSYKDGNYKSVLSRISVGVPVLGTETQVSVRESVLSRRANGLPITSHVLFIPGPLGAAPDSKDGVSAIVVTLLRDDRPKEAPTVLSQFVPPDESSRAALAQRGVTFSRVPTNMGEAVQRIVRNRAANDPFPYQVHQRPEVDVMTMGVTRYVVAPNDSLIEFSQVVPCNGERERECSNRAIDLMQRFMASVSEFLTISNQKTN